MKFVFLSNYFNHHQKPFSDAMYQQLGDEYVFIETESMTDERKNQGWKLDEYPPYVITSDILEQSYKKCIDIINNADVVVIGSAPEHLIAERKRIKKLIFRYSERPLKNGNQWWKYLGRWIKWHLKNPKNVPIYMLCASAYTASDYAMFGLFQDKSYRWGYFPQTEKYDDIGVIIQNKVPIRILWCGRFLQLKHPDDMIRVADLLKQNSIPFILDFIGIGPMEEIMRSMIKEYHLEEQVCIHPPMTPTEIRKQMEFAGIYVFTSDQREGWGAVINEAMNSGCAVICSEAAGSGAFLIQHSENGYLYSSGDIYQLYQFVQMLLDNPDKQDDIGRKAYRTIIDEWNAETAAGRLINISKHILAGEESPNLYDSGPCSKAVIIREK